MFNGFLHITKLLKLCVGGCGSQENLDHLFLHCDSYRQIWSVVYNWLGFTMVNSYHISDHLIISIRRSSSFSIIFLKEFLFYLDISPLARKILVGVVVHFLFVCIVLLIAYICNC